MNTKFTKGEWKSDYYDVKSNGKLIADCGFSSEGCDKEEQANAHLIAAAPDMYKLLERFLPMDGDGNGWDFVYDEGSEHMGEDVIALLAKARGES